MTNHALFKKLYFIFGFGTAILLIAGLVSFYANANAQSSSVGSSSIEMNQSDSLLKSELPLPQITVLQDDSSAGTEHTLDKTAQSREINELSVSLADRLPISTNEKSLVLDSIKILIEEEAKLIEDQAGWYHIAYEYYLPNSTQQSLIYSSDGEETLSADELIPISPVHEIFVQIDRFQNITSSISFLKDKSSGQVTQVAIWDGEASIQVNKRDAGFPVEDWKNYKKPEILSLSQAEYDNLAHALFEEETLLSGELIGTRYFVNASTKPVAETTVFGVDGSVLNIEVIVEFDALTGRLLSSETYVLLESGERVLTSKNIVLTQEMIFDLPSDVAALYEQNGFSLK